MKVIYIAGPHTGKSKSEIDDNIARAEEAAIQLWQKGWAVICPHKNTAHFEIYEKVAGITYDMWIDGDLEILGRCDAILMLEGWADSKGAKIEFDQACKNGTEMFFQEKGIPSPGGMKVKED